MRVNTMITLGASAAFGIMAVFLARDWINNAVENEFQQIKKPSSQDTVTTVKTTPVLIADVELAFGDILSQENVRVVNYPEDAVPVGAFNDKESLFGGQSERIVLSNLALSEPILINKITGPNGKASLSAKIQPGYRAFTVRVDDVSGVAGFVVPGDIVDVIYTREPEAAATQRLQAQGAASAYISDVMLQNITVLAVDQNQSKTTATPNVARTVTLEVTNEDAQALNLAMEYGRLSLSLRSIGETAPTAVRQLQLSDLNPSISAPSKRSAKQKTSVKTVTSEVNKLAKVTVIRGRAGEGETVERLSVMREQSKPVELAEDSAVLMSQLAGG